MNFANLLQSITFGALFSNMKILLLVTMCVLTAFVTSYAQQPATNSVLPTHRSPYNFVDVRGFVLKPTKITLEEPITILSSIDRAGGTLSNEKKIIVEILRLTLTSNNKDRSIDTFKLKDIRAGKSPNMILQAGDIVRVIRPQKIKRSKSGPFY